MLFNSIEFVFFFAASTILYFVIPKKTQWMFLLAASLFFYAYLVPYYIILLLITITNDYWAAKTIERKPKKKKLFLIESCIVNLGILFTFKYFNFFSSNVTQFAKLIGWNYSLPLLNILLPIGLSFYIFKSISYVVDVYRGNQKAEKDFGIYSLYVAFYPEILAGPIDRAHNLIHQLKEPHYFEYTRVTNGLKLMAWGFFKKVVIADRLAVFVNEVYKNPYNYKGVSLVAASVFFTIELYCDFSGYSDIAIGVGSVLGFKMPLNFDKPFSSKSIHEFWRRWHMTLSSWLRDYIYTPLTISLRKAGTAGVLISLAVTFFLAGLWHGAGWTFIIFGMLHATALIYEVLTRKLRKKLSKVLNEKLYNYFCMFLVSAYVTFSLIFFRSNNLKDALYICRNLFNGLGEYVYFVITNATKGGKDIFAPIRLNQSKDQLLISAIVIGVFFLISRIKYKETIIDWLTLKPNWIRWTIYYIFITAILFYGAFNSNVKFIYFQF